MSKRSNYRREKNALKLYPWVFECLTRDDNKCCKCGTNESLIVHHIDESRRSGNMNNNLDNLITLCRKCHSKMHGMTSAIAKEVVELRNMGLTFQSIGDKFGFTRQRAHSLYSKYSALDNSRIIMLPYKHMKTKKVQKIDRRLTILLTEKQHEQLRVLAFNSKTSIGTILRLLITKYIDKEVKG